MESLIDRIKAGLEASPFAKDIQVKGNRVFFKCVAEKRVELETVFESSEPFTGEDLEKMSMQAPSEFYLSSEIWGCFVVQLFGGHYDYHYEQVSSTRTKDVYLQRYDGLYLRLEDLMFKDVEDVVPELELGQHTHHFSMTDDIQAEGSFEDERYSRNWKLVPVA